MIVVASVEQLLRFILSVSPTIFDFIYRASGAHGIVLALVGVPLWVFAWGASGLHWPSRRSVSRSCGWACCICSHWQASSPSFHPAA